METGRLELAEQVAKHIKMQESLEFSVKEQGHRLDTLDKSSEKIQLQ